MLSKRGQAPGSPLCQETLGSNMQPKAGKRSGSTQGTQLAHLESSSLQELVSTGFSVFTMQVMADTTPAASSFFTRARTKLDLSWERKQLREGLG